MNQLSNLGTAALQYAAMGWHVFPCSPGSKIPLKDSNGVSDATTDANQITIWWTLHPDANIGIAPGESGHVVIDADSYKPECGWSNFTSQHVVPDTLTQKTAKGGTHLIFKGAPDVKYGRFIEGVKGVEIIRTGFYFMVTPSHVPEGCYTWLNPETPIADAPDWIPLDIGLGGGRSVGDPLLLETKRAETQDEVIRAIEAIDNPDEEWEQWNKVGMALWIATSGSEWGEAIWHTYSAKSDKYNQRETASRWHHFGKSPPVSLGMGTLVHMAGGRKVTKPAPPRIEPQGVPTESVVVPGAEAPDEGYNAIPQMSDPLLAPEEQAQFFAGCIGISGMGRIFTPRGDFLDQGKFNIEYGGHVFIVDDEGKSTDEAWKAATRGRRFKLPVVQGACFRPDLGVRNIVCDELGRKKINTYIPANVKKVPGDITPFMTHIAKLLPDVRDQTILLSYMAACIQYPGIKMQWAPVVQGAKGNGKTMLLNILEYSIGECYSHRPNAEELADGGSKFTGWIRNKLLIGVEEIKVGDRLHLLEILKPMITNARLEIQNKGMDQETGDNRANFFLLSNFKEGVPITRDERRWAIFYTAQQSFDDLKRDGMDGQYFPDLYGWLRSGGFAHVAYWLSNVEISDEFNPATQCHRAPKTTSTNEALQVSLGRVENLIIDAVDDDLPGFKNGWISSYCVKEMMKNEGIRIGPHALKKAYDSLGYHSIGKHSAKILQEGLTRPALYHRSPDANVSSYIFDQGYKIND